MKKFVKQDLAKSKAVEKQGITIRDVVHGGFMKSQKLQKKGALSKSFTGVTFSFNEEIPQG